MLVTSIGTVQGELIPGRELLSYFSSSCKSQGEWTRTAIGQAESLINSLDSIRTDPDCITISGVIGQLQILSSRVYDLVDLNMSEVTIEDYKAQEQELLLQISNTTDQITKDILEDSLRNVQLMIAGFIGSKDANNNLTQPSKTKYMAQTINATNALLGQALLNQTCLLKQPSILTGISSLAGSITSAATLFNPVLSLGVATGTELFGQIVESYKNGRIAHKIKKISSTTTGVAFQCVLESLSNQYCRATDAISFINLKAENRLKETGNKKEPLITAVRLFDREIPALLSWLQKIRFGVTPKNSWDADRQNEALQEQTALRTIRGKGLGTIDQNQVVFDEKTTDKGKWEVVRRIVLDLNSLAAGGGGGPVGGASAGYSRTMSTLFQYFYPPFYLIGFTSPDQVPRSFGTQPLNFDSFDPFSTEHWPNDLGAFSPNLEVIKERFSEWVDRAEGQVNTNLNFVLQPDALQVIADAKDPTNKKQRISPKEAMITIIDFLEANPLSKIDNGSFKKIYSDTVLRLKNILEAIEGKAKYEEANNNKEEYITDSSDILDYIYEQGELIFGVVFMQNRLEMAVRLSLYELYNEIKDEKVKNEAAQLLASDRFLDVLSSVSGTDNLSLIMSDVKKSIPITLNSLNQFAQIFSKNISEILNYYKNEEDKARTSFTEPDLVMEDTHRRSRTELCFGLLSVPYWPKKIAKDLCTDLQLAPIVPGGNPSVKIDESLIGGSHENRACKYRDYFRLSKIYQDWSLKGKN